MLEENLTTKYENHGSPTVSVQINGVSISNALVDLGTTINVITKETMDILRLINLGQTPTIQELTIGLDYHTK
jgi:hypothetical protein